MGVPIPLGVVDIVYAPRSVDERAELAVTDAFEHIDVLVDVDPATLPLPVGCPTAFPKPRPGWCSTPAPRYRHVPGAPNGRRVRWPPCPPRGTGSSSPEAPRSGT